MMNATLRVNGADRTLALDASITIRGASVEREVPIADFFTLPTDDHPLETTLQPGELILSIDLTATSSRGTFYKAMDRKTWAFALISVAASVTVTEGNISEARVVLGGVAPVPWRVEEAEQALIGSTVNSASIDRAVEAALSNAQPLEHNGYKVPLAKSLMRQALRLVAVGPLN